MSTPRVSIVVPTFNSPAHLLETLQAIFAQTFTDFELLVIDDGSTDNTSAVLASIADPRLRVIRQTNGGIGVARNRGLDEARGEFIAFCDHDDLWHPEKLAIQIAYLDLHPKAVAATCLWEHSTNPGQCVFDLKLADSDGIIIDRYRAMADKHQYVITSGLLIRRMAARGARYGEVRGGAEDVAFYMQLFASGDIGVAGSNILMTYRMHAMNFSKQASYFDIGVRTLRRMDAAGGFAAVQGKNRTQMLRFFAVIGRNGVINQLRAGHRGAAMRLYLSEMRHQARSGTWRFLALAPLLICLPNAVVQSLVNKRLGI